MNTRSINVTNVVNDNMKNEISNYKFTLNVPTETKIKDEMDKILQTKIKSPTLSPPYNLLPLLTTKK